MKRLPLRLLFSEAGHAAEAVHIEAGPPVGMHQQGGHAQQRIVGLRIGLRLALHDLRHCVLLDLHRVHQLQGNRWTNNAAPRGSFATMRMD